MKLARRIPSKIDVTSIVADHYRTLYDNRSRTSMDRFADRILFLGLPMVFALGGIGFDLRLEDPGSLLAAVAVLAGFLFALLIVLLEASITISARAEDGKYGATNSIRRRVNFLSEVKANVAYATLLAILSTAALALTEFLGISARSPLALLPSAAMVAVLVHLLLTLLMVVKRSYRVIEQELRYAETAEPPSPSPSVPQRPYTQSEYSSVAR